jgi:hypothetical protein
MLRTAIITLIAALSLALALTISIEQHRLQTERVRFATAALQATNTAAMRDSTVDVATTNRRIATLLGDSLRLVKKQVVQVAQTRDAIDKALGNERRANYAMTARIDSIQRTATAPVVASTATPQVRHADFALRQAPYTVTAAVDVPAPPDSAQLTVGIALDSIPLGVRVTCAPPDGNGIRTASVAATMPRWASAKLQQVEQSPELCASPALVRSKTSRRWFRFAPLVAGVGRTVSANGSGEWAAFLGTGILIWV